VELFSYTQHLNKRLCQSKDLNCSTSKMFVCTARKNAFKTLKRLNTVWKSWTKPLFTLHQLYAFWTRNHVSQKHSSSKSLQKTLNKTQYCITYNDVEALNKFCATGNANGLFCFQLLWQILGWVTVFGCTNHLSISPRPTQPPTLNGTVNEYQPKCGDTLQLEVKGRYGSFELWINVWVAGKTVWSLVPYLSA